MEPAAVGTREAGERPAAVCRDETRDEVRERSQKTPRSGLSQGLSQGQRRRKSKGASLEGAAASMKRERHDQGSTSGLQIRKLGFPKTVTRSHGIFNFQRIKLRTLRCVRDVIYDLQSCTVRVTRCTIVCCVSVSVQLYKLY